MGQILARGTTRALAQPFYNDLTIFPVFRESAKQPGFYASTSFFPLLFITFTLEVVATEGGKKKHYENRNDEREKEILANTRFQVTIIPVGEYFVPKKFFSIKIPIREYFIRKKLHYLNEIRAGEFFIAKNSFYKKGLFINCFTLFISFSFFFDFIQPSFRDRVVTSEKENSVQMKTLGHRAKRVRTRFQVTVIRVRKLIVTLEDYSRWDTILKLRSTTSKR